jgi:hypothetical protein
MSVSDHLAILRNPFSLAIPTGKVPDGKVNLSTSERLQTSFQKNFGNGEMTILLSPNFSTAYVVQVKTSAPGVVPATYDMSAIGYGDAGHVMTYDHNVIQGTHTVRKAESAADKWRLVSAGMRISLVNTSERNDGWFEAIRLNTSYSPQDFVVDNPQGALVDYMVYQNIGITEGGILNSRNSWANDPSYITGKLLDIHKWMFYLQASEERDFKALPTEWEDDLGAADGDHRFGCGNASVTPGVMIDSKFQPEPQLQTMKRPYPEKHYKKRRQLSSNSHRNTNPSRRQLRLQALLLLRWIPKSSKKPKRVQTQPLQQ